MAIYTSGVTRITGLSGIDTDTLINQLMTAESTKYNTLQQKVQKAQWQQESYRTIISKLQTFQDTYFGTTASATNFRYSKAFQNFKNTVLNSNGEESKAITIDSSTSEGSYQIKVNSLASAEKYTGATNSFAKTEITSTASLNSWVNELTSDDTLSFNMSYDDTKKEITLNANDLAAYSGTQEEKVISALQAKINTAFGDNKISVGNSEGYLQFKVEGNVHTMTITEGTARTKDTTSTLSFADGMLDYEDMDEEGNPLGSKTLQSDLSGDFKVNIGDNEYTISLDLKSGDTATKIASKINTALGKASYVDEDGNEKTASLKTKLSVAVEDGNLSFKSKNKTEDMQIDVKGGVLENLLDAENVEELKLAKTGTLADIGFTSGDTTTISMGSSTVEEVFGWDSDKVISLNGTNIVVGAEENISTVMTRINSSDAGVKMSYNSISGSFSLEASNTGANSNITFEATSSYYIGSEGEISTDEIDANTQDFFGKLFGQTIDDMKLSAENYSAGKDAVISIDGVETTRSSNDVSINGLKMTLNKVTGDDYIEVKVENNVDELYDKIKSFVDDYNTLITELNTVVKENRSKSDSYTYYEPLTEAQKEEMSTDEIEKWETEAKKGILYNDDVIKSFLSSMRSSLYSSVSLDNGTKVSLYQIGITTSADYTKNGALEIDEDKLKEALKNNGEAVQALFTNSGTGLADRMKKIADGLIGTDGTLRNKAGIENTASTTNNILTKQINNYNDDIADEKERLYEKELYYYQLFSQMESAISSSNTTLGSITSMLGS